MAEGYNFCQFLNRRDCVGGIGDTNAGIEQDDRPGSHHPSYRMWAKASLAHKCRHLRGVYHDNDPGRHYLDCPSRVVATLWLGHATLPIHDCEGSHLSDAGTPVGTQLTKYPHTDAGLCFFDFLSHFGTITLLLASRRSKEV